MGFFSTPIKTLDDLFVHTLEDIYYAENQIVKNLPTMIGKASNPALRVAFEHHLEETKEHVRRVEGVFRSLSLEVTSTDCPAIDGILKEAKEIISDCGDAEVCDAAMLSAAQAVEHYEMTRYGTLIAFARQLGHDECIRLLDQNLGEEKAADHKLTQIADTQVNRRAA